MSIAIVAMTKQCVAVTTDSRMITGKGHSAFQKLYIYSDALVSYGVGNAGIVIGFYNILDRIKDNEGSSVTYENLIATLEQYKSWVENNSEYSELFACIGICGIVNCSPIATTIGIGSTPQYKNITTPNDNLVLYIIPPKNVPNK